MKEPCYMGLDLSQTSAGVSVVSRFSYLMLSTTVSSERRGPARLADIRDTIQEYVETYSPCFIALEGYAMGAKWGREQAGELGGVIKVMLYEHQYIRDNIIIVPPANLKNFVGCKGNAPKEDVKLAVFQQYNVDFKGHKNDEADAYVLAQIARIVGTERVVDLQDFQRKALKKLLGLEDDGPKA